MNTLQIDEWIWKWQEHYDKQYSDAEKEYLERNLRGVDMEHLTNILYKNCPEFPKPKDIIKKAGYIKSITKQEGYEGCKNCVEGHIFAYNPTEIGSDNTRIFKDSKHIIHVGILIDELSKLALCPCTGKQTIEKLLDYMNSLFVSNYQEFELLYVSLHVFAKYYLNNKRFADFDEFNPYKLWKCPEQTLLKRNELKHYGCMILGGWKEGKKPVKVEVPEFKTIAPIIKELYNHDGQKIELDKDGLPF